MLSHPLAHKVFLCVFGGREIVSRDDRYRPAIEFLGVRTVYIIGPQPSLNVPHGYFQIKRGKRGAKGCRCTTTFYEMYSLASGGFIVDTPGLRGFGLVDLKKEEIALYFPEMLRVSEDCRFAPCTHTHEPGCAVKEAVEAGEISYDRYSSYLGMLDEEGKYR